MDQLIRRAPLSERSRSWMMEKKYGFFGTLLFHLFLISLFLLFKIGNPAPAEEPWVYFELRTLQELMELEMIEEQPETGGSPDARNIAVNQAEDRIENYDDYQNYRLSSSQVSDLVESRISDAVDEIIEENDLNPNDRELPDIEKQKLDFFEARPEEEKQVYQGPTNIYYNLEGREVSYLHVPVYKCEGSATVRVNIRVGQRGKVELVTIDGSETTTRDPCFIEAAKDAARRTRFNFSTEAPLLQQGYIIYRFIAQ